MSQVRPDEVSAILRKQLTGFDNQAEVYDVGTVLEVGDGIARVYGLSKVQAVNWWSFQTLLMKVENRSTEWFLTLKRITQGLCYSDLPVLYRRVTLFAERVTLPPWVLVTACLAGLSTPWAAL